MLSSKSQLKKPLYFPRCLVDDRVLWLRGKFGRAKKNVTCPKCGLMYARSAIKDADPVRWERTRERKLFKIHEDGNGRLIMFHQGLGSRRIADPTVVAKPHGARSYGGRNV